MPINSSIMLIFSVIDIKQEPYHIKIYNEFLKKIPTFSYHINKSYHFDNLANILGFLRTLKDIFFKLRLLLSN